ncbi:hypothetical protein RUND412_000429 [Rhizina undulata]
MASGSNTADLTIEVDPVFANDTDYDPSDYASGFESDTTSLISAVKNHTYENGRRYHGYKEGKYMIPNDEAEQDRMDLFHHCMLLAYRGELFGASVGKDWNPQKVLDLGTGSGIWAIDFADQFPEAQVIGVDLSPIQPQWVPPNLTFEVDDIEEPWSWADNSFDFIHIRHMAGHIVNWPRLYRQAFKALKPGGWIEVKDGTDWYTSDDDSVPAESSMLKHMNYFEEISLKCGKEFNSVALGAESAFKDIGYVDVEQMLIKLPVGRWPKEAHDKELGIYWRQHALDGIEAYALAPYTRVLGWETQALHEFLPLVYADLRNPKIHGYTKFYCTYGRKPLE